MSGRTGDGFKLPCNEFQYSSSLARARSGPAQQGEGALCPTKRNAPSQYPGSSCGGLALTIVSCVGGGAAGLAVVSPAAILGPCMILLGCIVRSFGDEASRRPGPRLAWAADHVVSVEVVKVLDEDTFSAVAHVWPGGFRPCLLRGIDAPELRGGTPRTRAAARKARQRLAELLAAEPVVVVNPALGKYAGRVIADVRADTVAVPQALLREGLARPCPRQ